LTSETAERNHWYNTVALNAYLFGISFMWSSIHPIILPTLLLDLVNERVKNSIYGLLTFVGLIIALIVQPLSGALSDHTHHHTGRRHPWILVGTLLDLGFLLVMALAKNYWILAAGYILLQFSSNLAHGPAQALIPDVGPTGKRGVAAGLKNVFDMAGIIVAALVLSSIMSGSSPSSLVAMAVIIGVLLVSMVTTLLGVREPPTQCVKTDHGQTPREQFHDLLSIDLGRHRHYAQLLIIRSLLFSRCPSTRSTCTDGWQTNDQHRPDDHGSSLSCRSSLGTVGTKGAEPIGLCYNGVRNGATSYHSEHNRIIVAELPDRNWNGHIHQR